MEIFVNDIKLPFSGTISLKCSNPLFNTIGSYSFPISFPARFSLVQKAFGFPGNIESEKLTFISGRVRVQEIDLIGEWKITDITESSIEAIFKGGTGTFNQVAGGKLLSDLKYNGITTPAGANATREDVLDYMTACVDAVYPTFDYTAFCAYMPNAMGIDETYEQLKLVNPIAWINNNISFTIPVTGILNSAVYLYVGAIVDYIFSEHGYRVESNIFRDDFDLCRLVLFNTWNQNGWLEFNYQNFVPRRTVREFLVKLQERLNISFLIDEITRTVVIDKFDNIVSRLDETNLKIISKKLDISIPEGFKISAEQVDDWTTNKFTKINEFPGNYSDITFVSKVRNVIPSEDNMNQVFYVRNEEAYYVVAYIGEAYIMQRICTNNLSYITGNGSKARDVAAGSPGMFNYKAEFSYQYMGVNHNEYADWLLPRCDLQCNFRDSNFEWLNRVPEFVDFPIMLVIACGFKQVDLFDLAGINDNSASPTFTIMAPFGSISNYDARGDSMETILSLTWNGDYGLIENMWKNRLEWEMRNKKIINCGLTGTEIRKLFTFSNAKRIENNNYLINTFSIDLRQDGLEVRDAELYRL